MTKDRWADLPLRLASAIVLLLIFSASLYFGRIGVLSLGFVAVLAMQWELARMFGLSRRRLLTVTVVAAVGWLPMALLPMVLTQSLFLAAVAGFLPIMFGVAFISHNRMVYIGYGALLTLGILSFWFLALTFGATGIAILAAVIILSDIGGYIAGRLFGGPKFWPAVSPKKTWSGTVVGWVLAGLLGLYLMHETGAWWPAPVAIFVAFGAQMGDIAESWVKRRMGVKDSSQLIPGHGGFLDRLDGFVGGAAAFGLIMALFLS
ncbi:phosphatidate cytidylyltransferase [Planktomarina sp.]|uniref:phosphatidate cytidylyltransferase n=1 Tax=uncultured Planktomarina sp. TaxID=1538529 RepID=UPI0023714073|nr:phosphatidate cytidylyltransferase [Planktomarina sp.]